MGCASGLRWLCVLALDSGCARSRTSAQGCSLALGCKQPCCEPVARFRNDFPAPVCEAASVGSALGPVRTPPCCDSVVHGRSVLTTFVRRRHRPLALQLGKTNGRDALILRNRTAASYVVDKSWVPVASRPCEVGESACRRLWSSAFLACLVCFAGGPCGYIVFCLADASARRVSLRCCSVGASSADRSLSCARHGFA